MTSEDPAADVPLVQTADEALAHLLVERGHHVTALDALEVGVIVVDRDLKVLVVNAAARAQFGMQPTSLATDQLGAFGWDVLREDGTPFPLLERPTHRAVDHGESSEGVLVGMRNDTTTRWMRVTSRPLHTDGALSGGAVTTWTDVTERRAGQQALQDSEAHFRLLAHNATDVIARLAPDAQASYVSPALTEVLGWSVEEVLGQDMFDLIHPDDLDAVAVLYERLVETGQQQEFRCRLRHRSDRWVWCETVARAVRDDAGKIVELQTSTRDVHARVAAEQRLAHLALADALTGLANRAALIQHLEDHLEAGSRLALLFLDLDRFKVVNDSLGHSAGDELLRTVAGRLSGASRDGDMVARLGGDEFVIVSVGLDEAGALALSDRVQRVLGAPVEVAGHELVMSASVGIVVATPGESLDPEDLLRDADVSMYQAKARGRAQAVVWHEPGRPPLERLSLERDLRAALDSARSGGADDEGAVQVVVHYQPQVELSSGRVVGVEALVRWLHPARGLLLPGDFLEVAEDTGLVVDLGRVVMAIAVAQIVRWRALPGCADLELAVNVSAQELVDTGRVDHCRELLASSGLPPEALTVEVLENVLLDAEGRVVAALEAWTDLGVRLALDDFGTGSSSLLHLRHVPVGVVKIDRAFVAGVGTSRRDEAIVRALRSLTADLDLGCIAEGVEEEHQRLWLLAEGVVSAQGYLLHRPLPPADVDALLRLPRE